MNNSNNRIIEMIIVSLLIGVAANFMLRAEPGANILVMTLLLVFGVTAIVLRWSADQWTADFRALNCATVFFAAMFALFDSPQLLALDFLALVLIFGMLSMPALRFRYRAAGILSYAASCFVSAFSSWFGGFFVVFDDLKPGNLPGAGAAKLFVNVARGLAIGAPVVIVIGALLMAADANFESIVRTTFDFDFDFILTHVLVSGIFAWLTLGYLRAVIFGVRTPLFESNKLNNATAPWGQKPPAFSITEHTTEDPEGTKPGIDGGRTNKPEKGRVFILPAFIQLGTVEVSIVLGLLNLLFTAFVVVQVPYLFGGMDLVQNTPDFKLAEYARRGVGELIIVAMLVLPLLLSVHWLIKSGSKTTAVLFKVMASIQIGLLFLIMISAMQRMLLLTGSLGYGMTTVRFYSMILLIWLAVVFGWFGMTVLRGRRLQFAYGTLWSALFMIGLIHFINPDAYIVERNTELMKQGRNFDAAYNAGLSDDALPALLESARYTSADSSKIIFAAQKTRCDIRDIRSWNLSRWKSDRIRRERGLCPK